MYSSDQTEKIVETDFRVLYICSAARGGSTVTDMFMGGHSQVASLGEINMLGKNISLDAECSCADKLRTCIEWCKVYDAILLRHGIDFTKNPYKFRLWDAIAVTKIDHQRQTNIYRLAVRMRRAWMDGRNFFSGSFLRKHFPIPPVLLKALKNKMELYRQISHCWNKSVIVDSSKNIREAIELHQRWPDVVKVVLLTRDGRGVYFSRRSSGFSQFESINGWLKYYRRAPLLENYIAPSSLLKIKYEDLATNPDKTGRVLCNFMNIPFEPEMLNLEQTTRHLVGGNNTRFAQGKKLHLDDRWQTELNGAELDFFIRSGGDMNYYLGYK